MTRLQHFFLDGDFGRIRMMLQTARLVTPDQFPSNVLDDLFKKYPAHVYWLQDVMDFRFALPDVTVAASCCR